MTSSRQWNGVTGSNWHIAYTSGSDFTFKFKYSVPPYPYSFGGAPALTRKEASGTTITNADIFFDPSWAWNQNGNHNQANQIADVRTVAVHELGHELRLEHPSRCVGVVTPDEKLAVMTADYTKKWTIRSDDEGGTLIMKPAP
jgi:hypothetical protein